MSNLKSSTEYSVCAVYNLTAYIAVAICEVDNHGEYVTTAFMTTKDVNGTTKTVLSDVRTNKLYSDGNRIYFKKCGNRYYLEDFVRITRPQTYPVVVKSQSELYVDT